MHLNIEKDKIAAAAVMDRGGERSAVANTAITATLAGPTTTPNSSPGLFSPAAAALRREMSTKVDDATPLSSPYLHALQMHKVKETHDARIEKDFITGRKCINQYEIIDEIGRGVHGKVKLARSFETGDYVAIKIIQRFSKKRRLGRVASPEQKIKREIAILKKVRHPNVVGLLEVIDDPEMKKIYMVLEHVELGEIVWRKKGDRSICLYERRRIEMEMQGEFDNGESEINYKMNERRRLRKKETARAKASNAAPNYWSLEHGGDEEFDIAPLSRQNTHDSMSQTLSTSYVSLSGARSAQGRSNPSSNAPSRVPSRTPSRAQTPQPSESFEIGPPEDDDEDRYGETPGRLSSLTSNHGSMIALEGTMYGSYAEDASYRGRSPSMPDSIISHMTSHDDFAIFQHDSFAEDYAYVPCFTIDQARTTFRDTVLGLEYLHYEGIVHRDIKPANLLWTKDHRVKISDFGVSYFGRPIRDGEPEENISEADAQDFDDDLELAKTVGTPAFFAPELCHTDIGVQHKVTEQIDVWSLGVTLYCLIFARIPFLAEDEFKLFRAIATEPVYIPRRRLKAVDPTTADSSNPQKRQTPAQEPYRDEGTLVYEDIDDELYDLLRRMLLKDPAERIKLREVKRHPWVLRGISNIIGWLDDTDPSRKTEGRRIQVDEKELEHAVVPITLLERARSNVKKVLGKVIGTISEGRGSRGRALSTAASSAGDSHHALPATPIKETRRGSLKGDESFFAASHAAHTGVEHLTYHPLSQSVISSPIAPKEDTFFGEERHSVSAGATPQRQQSYTSSDAEPPERQRPGLSERTISNAASIQTVVHRGHSYSRSLTGPVSPGNSADTETQSMSPERKRFTSGGTLRRPSKNLRHARSGELQIDMPETFDSGKHSDRPLFTSEDKHGEASIGVSNAIAPGAFEPFDPNSFEHARALNHSRSSDASPISAISPFALSSPGLFEPSAFGRHQHYFQKPTFFHSPSAPNVVTQRNIPQTSVYDERPATAVEIAPESRTPAARAYSGSNQDTITKAQSYAFRKQRFDDDDSNHQRDAFPTVEEESTRPNSADSNAPTSPVLDMFAKHKKEQAKRVQSLSSVASSGLASPSEVTSPISSQDPAFRSDQSLPALVSGASSISGDPEEEFLKQPGIVKGAESIFDISEGIDAQTPPAAAFGKDTMSSNEDDTPTSDSLREIPIVGSDDEAGYNGDGDLAGLAAEDEEDSDSDEGLTMDMGRKKPKAVSVVSSAAGTVGGRPTRLTRRGTNASVASTDTAKKVLMNE